MSRLSLADLYQEIILDHAKSPHHAGLREPFDGEAYQVNPTCGDEVTLRVAIGSADDGSPIVRDISYDAMGCSISQASLSVMADLLIGMPLAAARQVEAGFETMIKSKGTDPGDESLLGDAVAFAGVSQFVNRVKCALLGWKAFLVAADRAAAAPEIGEDGHHE